jgi:hypothetical protein
MIVSVSRRCDIPRFQFDWFIEHLNDGFVDVANPYNARQIRRVLLTPQKEGMEQSDGVDLFVFWTRDPGNILANAEELANRGFPFYVMVTVTGYPVNLEPNMIRTNDALTAMRELARKIGPDKVIWRYDPVILTNFTDATFHQKNFQVLSQELKGSVKRVIISLYDEYRGAKRRLNVMEKTGELRMLDADNLNELLTAIASSAETAGIEIQSCAEKEDFSFFGIRPGACIDAVLIENLFGLDCKGKDRNQRPHCLCCQSVDIGSYGTCGAGCVYCYAS